MSRILRRRIIQHKHTRVERLASPVMILVMTWVIVILGSRQVPEATLIRFWGDKRLVSWATIAWIAIAIVAFWAGTFIERAPYATHIITTHPVSGHFVVGSIDRLRRSIFVAWLILLLSAGITTIRLLQSIVLAGGPGPTLNYLLYSQRLFTKQFWDATNIHGIGVLSNLIVSVVIFSCAALALVGRMMNIEKGKKEAYSALIQLRRRLRWMFVMALTFLLIRVLAGTERVLLVEGFVSGFVASALVQGHLRLKRLIYLGLLLFVVWTFIEAGKVGMWGSSRLAEVLSYAKDRLFFYFAINVRNVDSAVVMISSKTWGWQTFRFLLSPFTLDKSLLASLIPGLSKRQRYVLPGLGTMPLFGTAYLDFGWAGLWYLLISGFLYQKLYRKAVRKQSFLALQLYSYCAAALIFSFVTFLPTLMRFWINVLGLMMINLSPISSIHRRRK